MIGTATLMFLALVGEGPSAPGDPARDDPARAKKETLHRLYLGEAEGYTMFRDSSRREKLRLNPEPVYVWTNPVRGGEQDGEVYIWTCRGRAEVVATFFSFPAVGPRGLHHELHALSTTTLDVTRPGAHDWTPRSPGLVMAPVPGAAAVGKAAPMRLSQMKAMIRDFAATTENDMGRKWDLRTLPQPLYRYESTDPNVIDGALFAFVTSNGTDPEMFVVLEARKAPGATEATWQYGLGRFTDMKLTASLKGKTVLDVPIIPWDSVPITDGPYRTFGDRNIPAIEEAATTTTSPSGNPR